MIPKKIPEALVGGLNSQLAFTRFNYRPCGHEIATLVKLECGAGGIQFRKFCTTCWSPLGSAIPHIVAHAAELRSGIEAPLADLGIIHAAQECYERRVRTGGLA